MVAWGRLSSIAEVNLEAVRLIRESGVSMAQVARDLGVQLNTIRVWLRAIEHDVEVAAFPGKGRLKPEVAEIERLRREVVRLKAARLACTRFNGHAVRLT